MHLSKYEILYLHVSKGNVRNRFLISILVQESIGQTETSEAPALGADSKYSVAPKKVRVDAVLHIAV